MNNELEQRIKSINKIFKDTLGSKYLLTKMIDSEIGYSIRRDYSKSIIEKLKTTEDAKYICLAIIFVHDSYLKATQDKVPLTVRFDFLLDRGEKNYFYDIDHNRNKNKRPVNIINTRGYKVDIHTQKFYSDDTEISLEDIYDQQYEKHIKPTLLLKGLSFRAKKFWREKLLDLITALSFMAKLLLRKIFNKIAEPENKERSLNSRSSNESKMKVEEQEKFEILGFKAHPNTIISYSLIHFLVYILFYASKYEPNFVKNIVKYQFLTIVYVVASLAVYSILIPKVVISILKIFQKIKDALHSPIKI